jgi:hypothetical protein
VVGLLDRHALIKSRSSLMFRFIRAFVRRPDALRLATAAGLMIAAVTLLNGLMPRKPRPPAAILTLVSANDVAKVRQCASENPSQLLERDFDGNTPLHIAALLGSREMVQALLESGADKAATNHDGETPLDSARRAGRASVLRLLSPRR